MLLYQTLAFTTHGKIQKSNKNNKFKIVAPTWNEEFELEPDISDYFEYTLEKHETVTDNPSITIYVNKVEKRITFKTKTGYYLEFLTPETMKMLGLTKSKITKDENGENVPQLEFFVVILVHCVIGDINYQQDSRVLYTFVPNKSFGQLVDISPRSLMLLKSFNSKMNTEEMKKEKNTGSQISV